MAEFERGHRAAGALEDRPVEQRVENWRKLRAEWGTLKPKLHAEIAGVLTVLAECGDGQWRSFGFELQPAEPHRLIGIGVSPANAPAE